MGKTYSIKLKEYNKCMNILKFTSLVFLDEIQTFDYKGISKYKRTKNVFTKIANDFKLVEELLNKEDLFNACTILRTTYEDIIYIIATTHNKKMKVDLEIKPKVFREELENNCNELFTEYFEKEDFNRMYKHLCKVVHPCSLKELVSYLMKTKKYNKYMINNMRYSLVIIEYMYLNYLYKKIGEENEFHLNLINLCTYVNLVNIACYFNGLDKNKRYLSKYMMYDTNNKYINDLDAKFKELYNDIKNNEEKIEINIKELARETDKQISNSKYKEIVKDFIK